MRTLNTTVTSITIEPPSPSTQREIARLFNDFRVFCGRSDDLPAGQTFIADRLRGKITRFFIAKIGERCVGFVHLVPYIDTLAMRDAWILEDLFVESAARRRGVGGALLQQAETFARSTGAGRISLTTAHTNCVAQSVYLAHGYALDTVFRTYHRDLV